MPVLLPDVAPWCEFCNEQLSIGPSADGSQACADCAAELVAAHARYEAALHTEVAGLHFGPNRDTNRDMMSRFGPNRAQRRAFRRRQRLHNDGRVRQ